MNHSELRMFPTKQQKMRNSQNNYKFEYNVSFGRQSNKNGNAKMFNAKNSFWWTMPHSVKNYKIQRKSEHEKWEEKKKREREGKKCQRIMKSNNVWLKILWLYMGWLVVGWIIIIYSCEVNVFFHCEVFEIVNFLYVSNRQALGFLYSICYLYIFFVDCLGFVHRIKNSKNARNNEALNIEHWLAAATPPLQRAAPTYCICTWSKPISYERWTLNTDPVVEVHSRFVRKVLSYAWKATPVFRVCDRNRSLAYWLWASNDWWLW